MRDPFRNDVHSGSGRVGIEPTAVRRNRQTSARSSWSVDLDDWVGAVSACPWPAHAGLSSIRRHKNEKIHAPLYTEQERARRDASPWTTVQAVLAPLQFLAFLISLTLVLHYLRTGHGYEIATASIIAKTILLYAIMITGSVWEKQVFGKWLFAPAFFWEDVFSMLVLGLQSLYLAALIFGWWSPQTQMMIAMAAYATYVINAAQFLLKLRAARLEGAGNKPHSLRQPPASGHPA